MSATEQRALWVRVAAALDVKDARRCLGDVLSVLAGHAIKVQAADDPSPTWLHIERHGRELRLSAPWKTADPAMCELLGHLIGTALARSVDHDERERIRERMDMLSSASFEGLMIHVDLKIIDANQRFCEMFGYEHAEILGDGAFARMVAPESQALASDRVTRRLEGAYLMTGIRKDGSRFLAEVHSKQGLLGANPVRVVALRDVTERERTLGLLREGEVRLRHLVEATFDFVVLSRGTIIVDVGGTVDAVVGFHREQMVGRSILDFIAPQQLSTSREILGEDRLGIFETVVVSAAGEEVPVEVVAVRSTLDGEPVRLTGVRDLREARRIEQERRKLELQLERSQRLESLGTLAGGIAHDFNNLLVGVLGNAELLSARLTDEKDLECSEAIRVAGERAASLTRQLLAYAGKNQPETQGPVDIAALWRELRTLLDATLSKKAQFEVQLEPRCLVRGDRATLMQVLMNLLTNASDALADRPGVIEVGARRVRVPGPEWQAALGAMTGPGEWVLVQVKDTGVGMDEATVARMFEPFFSTKPKGHGLGLAACLGIVAAHGGSIRVESALGTGTCISILLPALTGAPAQPAAAPPRNLAPKPCKVLVIDDEPLVRANIRRSLEQRGFEVFEAHNGGSGLNCYREVAADLLIIDFTMPDIDGAEVVRRIRAAGSTVPIILSSGYFASELLDGLPPLAIAGTLHKPYGTAALLEAIEHALAVKAAC